MKVQILIQQFKKIGHLLTVTKDGILQIWSETFALINSFRVRGTHTWSTHRVVGEPLPLYPNNEGDLGPEWAHLGVHSLSSLHVESLLLGPGSASRGTATLAFLFCKQDCIWTSIRLGCPTDRHLTPSLSK